MRAFFLLFVFLASFSVIGRAQEISKTLNQEQLLAIVRQYHPVVKQAEIGTQRSFAAVTQARAAFDPQFSLVNSEKVFDGQTYFNVQNAQLSIPTWYGIELVSGNELVLGDRINPSQTTGQNSYLGIQIPLLKNLLIDSRRATLNQAKLYTTLAKYEQEALSNSILFKSISAYWDWVKYYELKQLFDKTLDVNEKRFRLIKTAYEFGERPAIDTIEALTQLQQVAIQANQQALAFRNASLELSNYLWNENGDNVLLEEGIIPEGTLATMPNQQLLPPDLFEVLNTTVQMHPELKQYPFKQKVLEIEKRLKFQELLPRVDLSYNHLATGNYWLTRQTINPLMQNNFQYGLRISVPLRFSQGRGAYKEARLKVEELKWEQAQSITKIKNKVQSYYNDLINFNTQINLQKKQYDNNLTLQNAEEIRFLNGESSLFLINARESKVLETYDKLIDLKVKYYKSYYGLQWSAGMLN